MMPMAVPASVSLSVKPDMDFNESRKITAAATAKRQPTKNIGVLKLSAYCTARKVPPQIMVIKINANCAALGDCEKAVKTKFQINVQYTAHVALIYAFVQYIAHNQMRVKLHESS